MADHEVPESPKYEQYNFEEVMKALQTVRRQHLTNQPLVWTGPDRLHFSVAATSPEPSWHFSDEGMEHHREQGRSFWDVWAMIVFQLGYHNGAVKFHKDAEFWRRSLDRLTGAER